MKNLFELPKDLPIPQDDGACNHLEGQDFPSVKMHSTSDRIIDFGQYKNPFVIFFYPRTGEADKPTPEGWDLIPGARGCTPQSCGYRDLHADFKELGFDVFGASSQTTDYQKAYCWCLEGNPTSKFYEKSGAVFSGETKFDEIGGKQLRELAYEWTTI